MASFILGSSLDSSNARMKSESQSDSSNSEMETKTLNREDEEKQYVKALKHISKIRTLDFLDLLYFGPNGAVAKMRNSFSKTELAVKVEPFHDFTVINSWAGMHHANILPLIETIPIEISLFNGLKYSWTAYIMPFCPSTLAKQMFSKEFRGSRDAFDRAKTWIKQVIQAVCYMHRNGYYHLDIKEDNILLNEYGHAILADFTFVTTKSFIDKYYIGCPIPYKPPETIICPEAKFRSEEVDLWALGILILNILTEEQTYQFIPEMEKNMPEGWFKHLRPFLSTIKKGYKCFARLLLKAYPKHKFTDYEARICWNFVNLLLEEEPSKRLKASSLLKQEFVWYGDTGMFLKSISMQYLGACESCATLISLPSWESGEDNCKFNDCFCDENDDVMLKHFHTKRF